MRKEIGYIMDKQQAIAKVKELGGRNYLAAMYETPGMLAFTFTDEKPKPDEVLFDLMVDFIELETGKVWSVPEYAAIELLKKFDRIEM